MLKEAALGSRLVVLLAFLVWWLGFYSLTVLGFLLEPIRLHFGLSEMELAWLTGLGIGASGVGGFVFGWLADRLGRRTSMAIALATFGLGHLLAAAAPSFAVLLAARAVTGLGVGGSWGAGQALLGETVAPQERGRLAAWAQTGAPLGLGLATLVGTFAAPVLGWRGVFAASGLLLLALILVPRVPESPVWQRHEARAPVWRTVASPGVRGTFLRALLLTAFNMTNYWLVVSWLPRFLEKERGLTAARSGLATLAFVVGSFSGYLAFGALSDRFGRRRTFTLFCTLMAAGLLMFTVAWPLIEGSRALLLTFLFLSGLGTGTWSGYGPLFTELFPTAVRGTAMSVIMNLTRGIQFLAPLLIAAVAPRWGMAGGIALAAAFAVATAAWIWTFPETRGRGV
jgi:MFS family permease